MSFPTPYSFSQSPSPSESPTAAAGMPPRCRGRSAGRDRMPRSRPAWGPTLPPRAPGPPTRPGHGPTLQYRRPAPAVGERRRRGAARGHGHGHGVEQGRALGAGLALTCGARLSAHLFVLFVIQKLLFQLKFHKYITIHRKMRKMQTNFFYV